jgi:hypothetical protein
VTVYDQILELLTSQKIRDEDGYWHVYDEDGIEIADTGGVLWRANPGALLMWPRIEAIEVAPRGGRRHKGVRFEPFKPAVVPHNLAQLHQEDELVTDLLIALVTKEFFNGRT